MQVFRLGLLTEVQLGFSRAAGLVLLHDCVMAALAFSLMEMLMPPVNTIKSGLLGAPLAVTLLFASFAGIGFYTAGTPRILWRYVSLGDLVAIAVSSTIAVVFFFPFLCTISGSLDAGASRAVVLWLMLTTLVGAPRFAYRVALTHDWRTSRHQGSLATLLIVGTGEGTSLLLRALASDGRQPYRAVGIIDPVGQHVGRIVHGVRVLGAIDNLPGVVDRLARSGTVPSRLVITGPADPPLVRKLIATAEPLGLAVCRVPSLTEFRTAADNTPIRLEPIPLQELLGRRPLRFDRAAVDHLLRGRRVLVTGAGGSIGSELVRQVASRKPDHISLIDVCEYNLYEIDLQMQEHYPDIPRSSYLCDVRDRGRVQRLFSALKPNFVFHMAALKHVHLVELNPIEGVLTNVIGTYNVAEAACRYGAEAFVQVSSDKAVNPTGVMGATKRLAELYCQALDLAGAECSASTERGRPRFMTVRFGNVVGSSGSVIPLFQRQLAGGGPITITHPEIKRYFMSIEEAVELMLVATARGWQQELGRGKIFVLDMGEPVRIADVARQMIRLAGKEPEKDVRIKFIGLRPGEKLYEELFDAAETPLPSLCEGIKIASSRTTNLKALQQAMTEMTLWCERGDESRVLAILEKMVPGYHRSREMTQAVA